MSLAELVVLLFVGATMSLAWILLLRKTIVGRKLLDVPNSRSSHQVAVARGAGFVFALCAIVAGLIFGTSGEFIVGSLGLVVSGLGLVDDALNISARIRFSAQMILCLILIWPFVHPLTTAFVMLGPIIVLMLFLYLQSTINFYNFADGINGHIALQFIVAIVSWALLSIDNSLIKDLRMNPIIWALVGAIAVFLFANMKLRWVFMGDSGSTFLGFFIVAFPLYQMKEAGLSQESWLIFFSAMFIFNFVIWMDCFAILMTKIFCRVGISRAHRNHLYQQLSRRPDWGHSRTSSVLAFWQFSISVCFVAFMKGSAGWGGVGIGLAISYLALLGSAAWIAAREFGPVGTRHTGK